MGTTAIVLGWVPLVLGLDRQAGAAMQWALGAGTWVLLAVLLRRASTLTRAQVAVVIILATAVEYSFSAVLGVYVYRHHAIFPYVPPFVPPGHGLVYLAALRFGRDEWVRRHRRVVVSVALVATGGWALWGVTFATRVDVLGVVWFACLVWFTRRAREPAIFAGVALVVACLEIVGTHWGIWSWAHHDPTGWIPIGNPPSGAAGGYGFFDAAALAAAPWLVARARMLRRRPGGAVDRGDIGHQQAGARAAVMGAASVRSGATPVGARAVSSTSVTERPVPGSASEAGPGGGRRGSAR